MDSLKPSTGGGVVHNTVSRGYRSKLQMCRTPPTRTQIIWKFVAQVGTSSSRLQRVLQLLLQLSTILPTNLQLRPRKGGGRGGVDNKLSMLVSHPSMQLSMLVSHSSMNATLHAGGSPFNATLHLFYTIAPTTVYTSSYKSATAPEEGGGGTVSRGGGSA